MAHDRPRRRWGRRLGAAALAIALALTAGAPLAHPAPAGARPAFLGPCPVVVQSGVVYSFSATMSGEMKVGETVRTAAYGALCGTFAPLIGPFWAATIRPSQIVFSTSTWNYGSTPVTIALRPAGDLTILLDTGDDPRIDGETGGSALITGPFTVVFTTGGFTCTTVPFTLNLTTGQSGPIDGDPMFPNETDVGRDGMVVAKDFGIPPVEISPSCPPVFAYALDVLTPMPSAPGEPYIWEIVHLRVRAA